nr:integrase, catalytic region, zinc finger, CCHC-type, peptidase aspartic, catalytic [Tanacetum cinerariifolium]
MLNTNNTIQTQTSNTLHTAIMEDGGKDRPSMLALGNYVQWKSIIKRYIDTKPNHELIHYCLKNPPYEYTWADKVVPITEGSSKTTTERDRNDIYSTVDACPNACKMWKAIERLKQGESINNQDLETNLYWEFRKFTSRDGESLETYYSRFYNMMNELVRNQCDVTNHQMNVQFLLQLQPEWQRFVTLVKQCQELKTVSYQKLYDILKQHQNEVNKIRAERLTQPSMVTEDDEMSKDKEIDKLMALISLSFKKIYKPTNNNLRTSSNTSRANQDNSSRISRGIGYDNQRIGTVVGAGETVEVTPDAADNSRPIFNTEPLQKVPNNDNYNVFAIESEHPEQSKSVNDTYPIEQDEHNVIIDSLDMSYDREQIDQNHDDDDDLANERDLLASLIEKLKCEIDDSKNHNKFLETSNKEANNELSKTNELMYKDLKKFQAELDRYNDVKYASKVKIDCTKAKGDLMSYKMKSKKSFNAYTQKINDLNQKILDMKNELFAHQETISILSQAKEAQIKFYKTRKDKEIDKVIALENKVKVLDNIIYKTGQSVQTMNMLNCNCKTSFVKPEFLKKAQRANPLLYDIGCYNDNLALMLAPKSDEVIHLEKESRSKLSNLIRPFDYAKLNNLYDLSVPQREKSSPQRYFSERIKSVNALKNFSKLKEVLPRFFHGLERCKQTIIKRTYFGHIDPFIQNTIQGNFCLEIRRINADLEKFHLCLKEEMVADLRYFNSLKLEVDSLKSQLKTQKTQFLNEIDRLSKEYYYADHMNAILGVYTELDEVTNLQYRKHDAIERKNLLIANDNLIAECLSQEVFSVATNSELNEARFTKMHVANTIVEASCLKLKAELTNLRDKSHHDNQEELINHFSKLELQETRSDTDYTLKVRTVDSQITQLTEQVTNLQAQNDLFRAENDKIKQHYKALYDSIKITRAKHIEHVTTLTTENVNLKAKILEKVNSVSKDQVKPKVLARGKHAIDVEPIVLRLRNNRDAHLDYLRHLKESVETIRDIVEEAKVVRPLDRSIVSACRYTKHSQELLEYVVQIVLWYLDSGCSKLMTGDHSRLMNFVKKFIEIVRFENDHFGAIIGYGDYVISDSVISRDKNCQLEDILELFRRLHNDVQNIHEELAVYINTPSWDCPTVCYNDDDDEDYTIAITLKELDNSLSMREEHLDTILEIESDEFIKSSVENLVLNPSESEDLSDNISKEIYSNPIFDEEIISMKIDPHHFNAEYNLIESLLNHDSLIISSSSKIDSLFVEFADELTLLKSIPLGINETDCDPEEETRLIKRLLISPLIDSLFVEFADELTLLKSIPLGINETDCDPEEETRLIKRLFNDSLSFLVNESFHFDIPSSPHPPAKPPDGNSGISNVKVMGDIFEHKVPMPRLMLTQPTLVPNQEKSPKLLPHLGHEASQPSTECPMMIYERNTPILDVLFLHFYPP